MCVCSVLHVELLKLPWADVFTTNYDTLLERAAENVVTRRYETVVNKEDIPYATAPRIVKLHGSFPSERPFIITEEDYRRYPHDYAPFVNTVRQALLENTFCLIGFSGDDPNFLQWIGWMRDNFGQDKTQKIYLVGVFDLSPARLQMLAARGITVVDFSCCDGIGAHDHKKALDQFCEYMKSLKGSNVFDWPYKPRLLGPDPDDNTIDCGEEAKKAIKEWRKQREEYPGWLILQYENRNSLWDFTQYWVGFFPETSDTEQTPSAIDIQYAFELIWRLDRCLLPITARFAEFCEKVLERHRRFCTEKPTNSTEDCIVYAGAAESEKLGRNDIRKLWIAVALAMLRFYREEGLLEKWKNEETRLKDLLAYLSDEQREFLNYEGFLFCLFNLDLPEAKRRLGNWQANRLQPYWMAKRATALAEIGLLNEATVASREALKHIRNKLAKEERVSDPALVSMEANAMLIAKYVQDAASDLSSNRSNSQQNTETQFKDRWLELKGAQCDPWNELRLLKLSISDASVKRNGVTEKRGFDIGRRTITRHFSGADRRMLNAYAFLRFCEEVGLPFRVGRFSLERESAMAALQRISQYSLFWAVATLARAGDSKAVDSLFNRESVYRFTADEADQVIQSYLDVLDKCRDDIRAGNAVFGDNVGVRLARLLPEVISRLCCKCSMETKRRVLEFVTGIYASPDKTKFRNVGNLVERLLRSMSPAEQYRLIPDLLKIPFPGPLHHIVENDFPNPVSLLDLDQKAEGDTSVLKLPPDSVDSLLLQAAQGDAGRRGWAISALVKLHDLQLLDSDQSKRLGDAIWRKTERKYWLPDETGFNKFIFLRLPHPAGDEPAQRFKEYVQNTPFPIEKDNPGSGVRFTGGHLSLVNDIVGANSVDENFWTAEDAVEILQKVARWWDADRSRLRKRDVENSPFPSNREEFRLRFARIVELLARVVGPKLGADCDDAVKDLISRLLNEMGKRGLPVLEAAAACLHIFPEQESYVFGRIKDALRSNQDSLERDGLRAIYRTIIAATATEHALASATTLLEEYLTWKPTRSITTTEALEIIAFILKKAPDGPDKLSHIPSSITSYGV